MKVMNMKVVMVIMKAMPLQMEALLSLTSNYSILTTNFQ